MGYWAVWALISAVPACERSPSNKPILIRVGADAAADQPNPLAQQEPEQSTVRSWSEEMIAELRADPVKNARAARWFMALSFNEQVAVSEKLGTIVLRATEGKDFVVAWGAADSPYPWAFIISPAGVTLTGSNAFSLRFRDDEFVSSQWGAHWVVKQAYLNVDSKKGPAFEPEPPSKGQTGFDRWLAAGGGWSYVGPALRRQAGVLRANKASRFD